MQSYIHKETGKEIITISGFLTYFEEQRLSYGGRDILCAVGVGIIDNSCCGTGGCGFIDVVGYIVSWQSGSDEDGRLISKVDPIMSEKEKKDITTILEKLYPHFQINFS
jgi:hypothetical protein